MTAKGLTRELRIGQVARDIANDASVPATIATNTPVVRDGLIEVLDCSATGTDLSRAPLPLIVAHDQSKLAVGVVEDLRPLGDKVTGSVRFGTSPEAQQIRADVIAGIHSGLSVGYSRSEGAPIDGGFIYRWMPYEVSITPIPADKNAGFFRNQSGDPTMTTTTQNTEIKDLCKRYKMDGLADTLIQAGATVEQTRAAILERLADADRATGGHLNVNSSFHNNPNAPQRDLLVNTLVQRMGGKPNGEVLRSMDCTGIAIQALEMRGVHVSHRDSRDSILHRAMGTSDFPQLLGNAAGRVLLAAYEESPATLKQVARMNNLPNFKDRTVIRMPGGAPSLEKVNESGEFTHGAMNEAGNGWKLATYGRIVSLSRQALVNDDLGAFAELLSEFGKAAARREADELVSMLMGTPLVDGSALFHADRSSLISGAGSALQLSSLTSAVKSLRLQKEVGGGFIIQEPSYLVVPAALETTARQLVAAITPNTTGDVQPYRLTVIVEPRLDAASTSAWYLVAGNQSALEYGYLDGAAGPQTFLQEGFDVDGTDFKCRLDFGAGWVSPVGWVKSLGA